MEEENLLYCCFDNTFFFVNKIMAPFCFYEAFPKNIMKKLGFCINNFPKFMSRCKILRNSRMLNILLFKWQPYQYKLKFEQPQFRYSLFAYTRSNYSEITCYCELHQGIHESCNIKRGFVTRF